MEAGGDRSHWRSRSRNRDRRWGRAVYPGRVSHRCLNRTHTLAVNLFLAQHCKRYKPSPAVLIKPMWTVPFAKHHLPLWKWARDNLRPGCQSTPPSPRGAGICKQAAVTSFNTQPFPLLHSICDVRPLKVLQCASFRSHFCRVIRLILLRTDRNTRCIVEFETLHVHKDNFLKKWH